MKSQPGRSWLDRGLGLFAEVRAGEGANALLLALNIFLLLGAYYIMKPVREALILSSPLGAELKSYMSAGQALLLVGYVPLYARLASRLGRRRLLSSVTLFFAACIGVFYLLGRAGLPIGVPFFLWIGIFSVSLVAQFWSFANDLYLPEQGKRLFAIVQFGGSAGAVLGATLVGRLIAPIGIYASLLVAGGVLLASLAVTLLVDRRAERPAAGDVPAAAAPLPKGGAYRLLFGNRYLLAIACLVLLLNWVNSTGEFILGRVVGEAATASAAAAGLALPPAPDAGDAAAQTDWAAAKEAAQEHRRRFIGKFYADFFSVVNAAGLLVQLLLVSRILKVLGVRVGLLILPTIALVGYALAAFLPLLAYLRWAKTAENATDYSLMNTLRGVLFLPTTREEKYKAKQAIDTLFMRAGDTLSALLVFVGLNLLGLGTRGFALVNLALVGLWFLLALRIGRGYAQLSAGGERVTR